MIGKIKGNHFVPPFIVFQIYSGISGSSFKQVSLAVDKLLASAAAIPMTPYSPMPRAPYGPSTRGGSTNRTAYVGALLALKLSYVRSRGFSTFPLSSSTIVSLEAQLNPRY